jgi:hypothetical protein
MGSGGTSGRILNLSRSADSFTSRHVKTLRAVGTHCTGDWVSPKTVLDAMKKKTSPPVPGIAARPQSPSHYTGSHSYLYLEWTVFIFYLMALFHMCELYSIRGGRLWGIQRNLVQGISPIRPWIGKTTQNRMTDNQSQSLPNTKYLW